MSKVYYGIERSFLDKHYNNIEEVMQQLYTHSKKMTQSIDYIINMPDEIGYDDIFILNNKLATADEAIQEIGEDMQVVCENLHAFLVTLAEAEKLTQEEIDNANNSIHS